MTNPLILNDIESDPYCEHYFQLIFKKMCGGLLIEIT